MRGRFALVAEVLERGDESAAEEGLPLTVHGDAGRQRVLGREEPAGESQAVGRGILRQGWEESRYRRRDLLPGAEIFAAMMEESRTRVGGRALTHDERRLAARDLLA